MTLPQTARIDAVNLGKAAAFRGEEASAIAKQPAAGAVVIGAHGLVGDEQADQVHHGGPEMALHHYPRDHYPHWQGLLGDHPLLAGQAAFGENISTLGMTETEVCLGDRYRLGSALVAADGADVAQIAAQADGTLVNPLTGARIAAISPMHTLGHPVRIEEICDIAAEYGVPVVEDAAESLGSWITTRSGERKHTGTFGLTGMISFNGNKTITTGGGGVILTDDDELGPLAKHLTTTAKMPHKWEFEHDHIGWNFRMPNLNAALGMAQLEKFDRFLDQKRRLAVAYGNAFADFEGGRFSFEPEGTESNYWLCAVQLAEPSLALRDEVLQACHDAGFLTRPMWNLLHQQRMYASAPAAGDSLGGSLDTAIALHASLICIPSTPKLAERL